MSNKIKGIYKIINKINNKIYIGESMDIDQRWNEHKDELRSNRHHSYKLQSDWNKYGEDNFSFEIIRIVNDEDDRSSILQLILYVYEDMCIKEYNSIETGYNIENTLLAMLNKKKPIYKDYIRDADVRRLRGVIDNIKKNNGIYLENPNNKNKRIEEQCDLEYINNLYKSKRNGRRIKNKKQFMLEILQQVIVYKMDSITFNKNEYKTISQILNLAKLRADYTFEFLRQEGIINEKNIACDRCIKSGYFHAEFNDFNGIRATKLSQEGVDFIKHLILDNMSEQFITEKFLTLINKACR